MNEIKKVPVIFLAFANDPEKPLPGLEGEYRETTGVLKEGQDAGLCEVVTEPFATRQLIFDKFSDQRFRNRIAVFHYAGHAGAEQLHLTDADGTNERANTDGLARLFAQQTSLQLVFLNGCGTLPQVKGLLKAKVPAVIATSTDIADGVAKIFASRFYRSLANGVGLHTAFKEAEAEALTHTGEKLRDLYVENPPPTQDFPWQWHVRPGAEVVQTWSLPQAVDNPLFGLPELLKSDLPDSPFRHLSWFGPKHAEVFFGRGNQIRDLYTRITTKDSPPIILFYGQSGIGKSSILAAGLTPRLKATHEVRYERREQGTGLLAALFTVLECEVGEQSLKEAWLTLEAKLERPVAIILDQVEEVFTRPNPEHPKELDVFMDELQVIFWNPDTRPKGKVILSFRKEWFPEVEGTLIERKLPRAGLFVKRLNRMGVIEAIMGPSSFKRLQDQYGLTIEDGLPEVIAGDLVKDSGSALAPTLQILLTKMWKCAKERDPTHPHFDAELYRQSKGSIHEFLVQQLKQLEEWNPEAVQSGLVLDLLAFHVTPLVTAGECMINILKERYAHQQEHLMSLLQQCKDLYLLVEAEGNRKTATTSTRLAHDTLAPFIRKYFDESDKFGQRALHILENRLKNCHLSEREVPLGEVDLAIVEKGKAGMRVWTPKEQDLVRISRAQRTRRKFKRIFWQAVGVLATFMIGGTLWLHQENYTLDQALLRVQSFVWDIKVEPEEMITIAGGSFWQGDIHGMEGPQFRDEKPVRKVKMKPFALGKYLVTFKEYDRFAIDSDRDLPDDQGWGRGPQPVINVSWKDAMDYANWLSEKTGKRFRLPTESEWEYAARSRDTDQVWAGTSNPKELKDYAVYDINSGDRTARVGSKLPNKLGFHDMSGNVWEWVRDCWHEGYKGAPNNGLAWLKEAEGNCRERVIRGGAWDYPKESVRSANRTHANLVSKYNDLGFRLAQEIE